MKILIPTYFFLLLLIGYNSCYGKTTDKPDTLKNQTLFFPIFGEQSTANDSLLIRSPEKPDLCIKLFPVPVQKKLTIDLRKYKRINSIKIEDATGENVREIPVFSGLVKIDLEDLKPGFYFIFFDHEHQFYRFLKT